MVESYWGAAGTEPNPFAGWSEARKRFFEQYGYDRGPATPETTVKVTETPPDDPTPTTRVTTTKYPEGMEEGGPIVSEPMLTAPGTFEGSRRSPPVPAGMLDTREGVMQQEQPGMQADYAGLLGGQEPSLWEQINRGDTYPDDLPEYGPPDIIRGIPEEMYLEEEAVDPLGPQDYIAGLPPRHEIEGSFLTDTGEDLILTTGAGNEYSMNKILFAVAAPIGKVGSVSTFVGKRIIKMLPKPLQKRIYTWLGNKRRAQRAAKPTEYDVKAITRPSPGASAGPETKIAIEGGARTAGARTAAQTTAEAANAAKVGGRFTIDLSRAKDRPIRTGIKAGLKIAAPVATVGLLDEGSEEERAAGEWPGLVDLEGIPWWLKRAYDASRAALGAGADSFAEYVEKHWESLTDTEKERASKQAQEEMYEYSPYGEERGRGGLLEDSPAEVAGTSASKIAKDLQITHEKGLARSTFTKSERHRLEAAKQYKESEIQRVAAQDAEKKQADLDRYYANFPEDVEGKRERYLKALNQIYKKVAILNVIAALTNSPSQAGTFMQMAAEKFKTLEGFRGEERLQKIARGVFFDENGVFDAPLSKQDAFNRAMRFGANHDEALALSGHQKDATPSKTETGVRIWSNAETGQEIWLPKDQAPTGQGWLPKSLAAERTGTEFERMRSVAIDLINGNNVQQAIRELSAWLMGKDSMLRFIGADEADLIATSMVERWAGGIDADPESVAAELGIDTSEGGGQPTNIRRG